MKSFPRSFPDLHAANLGAFRGWARNGIAHAQLQKAVGEFDRVTSGNILKKGRRTLVFVPSEPLDWVVKVYAKPDFASKLRSRLGQGRARRALQYACELQAAGVATSTIIGCLEGKTADCLVTTRIHGEAFSTLESKLKASLFPQAMARLVARIHAAGLRARDLRFENLILQSRGKNPLIFLIDFDGIRKRRNETQRLQDLFRVLRAFPRSWRNERKLFLKNYLEISKSTDSFDSLRDALKTVQRKDRRFAQEDWILP